MPAKPKEFVAFDAMMAVAPVQRIIRLSILPCQVYYYLTKRVP